MHAVRTILSKYIVTDVMRSAARVVKDPLVVNWKYADGTILQDINTVGNPSRTSTLVQILYGPLVSPTRMRIQDIGSPRGSIDPQELRNA